MGSDVERTLRARIGGHALHAKYGSRDIAARARQGLWAKFEREVDPDGVLPPEERENRATQAQKAYYAKLSLKAAQARSGRQARASGRRYTKSYTFEDAAKRYKPIIT